MRFTRFALLGLGLAAVAGCKDSVSTPSKPPLGGVRFINAVADTSSVDIRMIDQLEWSANALNLNFRAGTEHFPTEAKARRIRVFAFTSASPTIPNVTKVLHDTTITIRADRKVTLLLTGSARAGKVHFVEIEDNAPALGDNQIAVRTVNTATGAVDVYYTTDTTSSVVGSASVANVGSLVASPYTLRTAGKVSATMTDAGTTTANATLAGPAAPTGPAGAAPAAGVNSPGSAFSIYYFPRGVAGSPQNSLNRPAIQWFVDAQPLPK